MESEARAPERTSVRRWDIRHHDRLGSSMYPIENGNFVDYADYEALRQQCERAADIHEGLRLALERVKGELMGIATISEDHISRRAAERALQALDAATTKEGA